LQQAMPFLLVATAQVEKYDMPGEFAFLPWVESSYTMIPPNGDGVAGMWQLMPLTARESGLRIDADYDGRLDVYASSQTALVLLKQYEEEFGDWRLANMAFNAGVNGVRQAIANQGHGATTKSAHLYLNQTTDEHLTKLLAMACIVSSPARFGVVLPEPQPDDVPTLITLPAPIDLRLAAQIADIDYAQMQRWNPAYLKGRMPDGGPYHLLVPVPRRAALERTLGMLPQYAWRDWRDMKLQQEQKLDTLAMAYDLDPQALATINHLDADVTLPAGKRLLLPGRDNNTMATLAEPMAPAVANTGDANQICTVRAGDTLWDIARRYRLRVDDLVQWNRLSHNATLRLGQRLLLAAPH
jgi:membrane-bound lytic murein transglycosylase D